MIDDDFGTDVPPRDAALRRALDNAPDRGLEPSHHIRRAIHLAAYAAVEPEAETIDLDESIWRMWWRRLRGGSGGEGSGGRRPWTAAFATLLVAGIVTLLWQREPVPDARLDGETAQAPAAAPPAPPPPAPATVAPVAPPPPPAPAPAPAPVPAPAPAPAPQQPAIAAAPPPAVPATPVAPPTAPPVPSAAPTAPQVVPPVPGPSPAPSVPSAATAPPAATTPPAGAAGPLARQEPQQAARESSRNAMRLPPDDLPPGEAREAESRAKAAAAPPTAAPPAPAPKPAPPPPAPVPAPSPAPPPAPVPAPRPAAPPPVAAPAAPPAPAADAAPPDRRAAARARDEAAAGAPAPAPQRAAPPGTRTDATDPPTFAALSQWRRVTILRTDGSSRNLSREEIPELAPVLGSAALVAVTAQPLPDEVEYRVVLERANGDRLASLDVAGNWVRWREGRLPAGTGAPSAGALAALREALRDALER